jgi:RHS repeat-associated protein
LGVLAGGGPTNGLVGWWKFNEGTGGTAADSSGNGNVGILTGGATWTAGVASNAINLDGSSGYINVGNKSTLQNNAAAWTFAGWVNPDTFNSTRDTYLFYKDNVLFWGFRTNTSRQVSVNIGTGNGSNPWGVDATSSAQLNAGGWSHVAVTYTNSTVKFYVNGILSDTLSKTYQMGSKNSAFTISTSSQSFDGKLDDMRYYNRALSDSEVAALYGEQATGNNSVYLADALGSVVALMDSNRVIQTSYAYEPFGQSTSHGSPITNPFTFTGREDDKTAMYYYRARYYHPALGRFVGEDPATFVLSANFYAMVGNDPLNYRDPLGLWQVTITLGSLYAGQFTFGKNSGQWNYGLLVGAGEGFSFEIDPKNSGCQKSGLSVEVDVSGKVGAYANASLDFNVSDREGFTMGMYVGVPRTKLVNLGKYAELGVLLKPYDLENPIQPAQKIGGGESIFMGAGLKYYQKCKCP